MSHPIPPGTRDVLPDEMLELRELSEGLRTAFGEAGYGEVWTPALEYEETLRTGDAGGAGAGYRLFDEQGEVLALRSDMTIPIARVVATRLGDAQPPLRLCYFGHAYRAAERRTAELREFLQGGIELIGLPGAEGEAEVIALTEDALDRAGLRRHRVGVGDGTLFARLLDDADVPEDAREGLVGCLSSRDLVGLERRVDELGLGAASRERLVSLPSLRGGAEVLERAGGAVDALLELHELLAERGVADRVIFDLGLLRQLGYYTGPVFEVYDPAVGFALGGGGRYDELIGRFGRPLPACGMALDVGRVHLAQAAEERLR
ncbi:MAG: ATP phosphoribosyltransferase regulatory subunit [Actinomycetota bacterium]|nr:ATP phosphoribosyltransferase regulatory subunit [Actinomycetota bacterium]MDQ3719483.1 ATP phosphoribosyltransferase regulatory subunit [Actinomycetota bacterium]